MSSERTFPAFNGSESASDIARAAIEWFAQQPYAAGYTIFYENSVPKMKYELDDGWVEFVCVYRLDEMLASFYVEAERIFDEHVRVKMVEAELREMLVPYIAFSGMTTILTRLLILQTQIFLDTFEEAKVTAIGMFLHSLVTQRPNTASLSRGASKVIQRWIDEAVTESMKKKRDFLTGYMNTQRLIHIPTSVGRPKGSTKPENVKAQEAAEYEKKVEAAIRKLISPNGKMPSKRAVAKELGIGGLSAGGTDSSLTNFSRKLKGLKIDYNAIVERVKLCK